MSKYTDIKRKHFRFPAYDDDEGVKLHRENKRNLFAKDRSWLLTDEAQYPQVSQKNYNKPDGKKFSRSPEHQDKEERTLRRSRRSSAEKSGHSLQQEAELKKHRENLPDYSKKVKPVVDKAGRTSLFGKEYRRSAHKVRADHDKTIKAEPTLKRQYSGRSYFVPKYIPASIIPDVKDEAVTDADLMEAMKKPQDSYLLFDTDPSAYQEKKEGDPSVKKFNSPETEELNITREEYQKLDPDKKNRILDRSLEGLIQEGQVELEDNGLFHKDQ